MADMETLANMVSGVARNIAFNLDFIPDDKLAWKPAPSAKSALEVAQEVVDVLSSISGPRSEAAPLTSREDAKQKLVEAADGYAKALRSFSAEQLAQPAGRMQLPLGTLAAMLAVDCAHHHGQIAYIQTLLGDTESHFAPDVLGYLA